MERNIPHVLDIFVSSPGERRRMLNRDRETEKFSRELKDQQKNPGSDSAVCLCSSSDEDERNISKYFDYLNDDADDNSNNSKKKRHTKSEKKPTESEEKSKSSSEKEKSKSSSEKEKSKSSSEKENTRNELEKDIKQIERHLSMKKTIRKKMMRDLQQAFVEDPKEFQQDQECIPPERKNNINIQNLTISKKRMSKSEHSFLDMLKENEMKDRKTSRGHGDGGKTHKNHNKRNTRSKTNENDSGNDSPTREGNNNGNNNKQSVAEPTGTKDNLSTNKTEKKTTFWQRLTGKGKTKR